MMTLEEAKKVREVTSKKFFRESPIQVRTAFRHGDEILFDCVVEGDYVLFRESEIEVVKSITI